MSQNCPLCREEHSREVISFGDQPNSYDFRANRHASIEKHSLRLNVCDTCGFVFIPEPFPAAEMYENYRWSTSFRPAPHTDRLVEYIGRYVKPGTDDLIVDIGCNDGYLLRQLRASGHTCLVGVEPAGDCARDARESGLSVVEGYYDEKQAKKISDRYGKARVVVCKHVLEHVQDPHAFIGAINQLMHPDGLLILEVPDFETITRKGDFSSIWEQHVSYFALASLEKLLSTNGLSIEQYSHIEFGGGSLLLYIHRREKPTKVLPCTLWNAADFRDNIQRNILSFRELTAALIKEGHLLSFFGAGARGISLLNFSGRGEAFQFVADDNPGKRGLYIPGCDLPVVSSNELFSSDTTCCFLSPLNSKAAEAGIIARFKDTKIRVVEFFPGPFHNPESFFRIHNSH